MLVVRGVKLKIGIPESLSDIHGYYTLKKESPTKCFVLILKISVNIGVGHIQTVVPLSWP